MDLVFSVVGLCRWGIRFRHTSGSEASSGGILPTVDPSSSSSSRYEGVLTNLGGLEQRQLWPIQRS